MTRRPLSRFSSGVRWVAAWVQLLVLVTLLATPVVTLLVCRDPSLVSLVNELLSPDSRSMAYVWAVCGGAQATVAMVVAWSSVGALLLEDAKVLLDTIAPPALQIAAVIASYHTPTVLVREFTVCAAGFVLYLLRSFLRRHRIMERTVSALDRARVRIRTQVFVFVQAYTSWLATLGSTLSAIVRGATILAGVAVPSVALCAICLYFPDTVTTACQYAYLDVVFPLIFCTITVERAPSLDLSVLVGWCGLLATRSVLVGLESTLHYFAPTFLCNLLTAARVLLVCAMLLPSGILPDVSRLISLGVTQLSWVQRFCATPDTIRVSSAAPPPQPSATHLSFLRQMTSNMVTFLSPSRSAATAGAARVAVETAPFSAETSRIGAAVRMLGINKMFPHWLVVFICGERLANSEDWIFYVLEGVTQDLWVFSVSLIALVLPLPFVLDAALIFVTRIHCAVEAYARCYPKHPDRPHQTFCLRWVQYFIVLETAVFFGHVSGIGTLFDYLPFGRHFLLATAVLLRLPVVNGASRIYDYTRAKLMSSLAPRSRTTPERPVPTRISETDVPRRLVTSVPSRPPQTEMRTEAAALRRRHVLKTRLSQSQHSGSFGSAPVQEGTPYVCSNGTTESSVPRSESPVPRRVMFSPDSTASSLPREDVGD